MLLYTSNTLHFRSKYFYFWHLKFKYIPGFWLNRSITMSLLDHSKAKYICAFLRVIRWKCFTFYFTSLIIFWIIFFNENIHTCFLISLCFKGSLSFWVMVFRMGFHARNSTVPQTDHGPRERSSWPPARPGQGQRGRATNTGQKSQTLLQQFSPTEKTYIKRVIQIHSSYTSTSER